MSSVATKLYEATEILSGRLWNDYWERHDKADEELKKVRRKLLGAILETAETVAVHRDVIDLTPIERRPEENFGTKEFLTFFDGSMLVVRVGSDKYPTEFALYEKQGG